jgi:hypothetical protein
MTAIPTGPPPATASPRPRWGAGRVIALTCGILLLLPGMALVAGGGALLWADRVARSGDYLVSATSSLSAPGYAITSNRITLSDGTSWVPVSAALGTARVDVTSRDGRAVFVGIAPAGAASSYLDGVGRTVVDDLGNGGNVQATSTVAGGPAPTPPAQQTFWASRVSGTGTQRLTWSPGEGDWALVVMNADGSPGVSVQARVGATVPALGGLAWGLLAGGLVLVLAGVLLVVLAARRRATPASGYGGPVPQEQWPAWAPPQPRGTAESPGPARTGPPEPPRPAA